MIIRSLEMLGRFLLPALLFMFVALSSCSSGDGDVNVQNNGQDSEGIELPVGINVATLPADGSLHAYISVDGGPRQELTIDLNSQTVSGSLSGISTGSHTFTIEVVFIYNDSTEVMLASADVSMDVGAGDNSLSITSSDYTTDFDTDGDGVSNLAELDAGLDPTNPADTECVIGTSVIGNCVLG